MDAFGYKLQAEFEIFFNDEKTDKAMCIALEPPEKVEGMHFAHGHAFGPSGATMEWHLAPEIFVSEGTEGSIVDAWVKSRGGIGGIHHLAYQVQSVEGTMKEWQKRGWGDFTSKEVMRCEGLTQIFSKPHALTGVIFEFIEREGHGFCKENVKSLMESTAKLDGRMT